MKELGLHTIPLAEIDANDRLRPVDAAQVDWLAENIAQVGRLRQPIEVRKLKKGGYRLIAGAHRKAAVERIGWTEIPAFVFDASDDEAKLAEIDENLIRHELNPLDRAVFLAERKALYLRLYPEAKGGKAGAEARWNAKETVSFASDTAERIGLTTRTINLAVMIASRLAPDVRARIAGTWIARNQKELLALAKQEHKIQRAIVDHLLAPSPVAKSVQGMQLHLFGSAQAAPTPKSNAVEKLYDLWSRIGRGEQLAFLTRLKRDGKLDGLLREMDEEGDI